VIIPAGNAPELTEIPEHVRSKLTITPVRTMSEVLELALAPAASKEVKARSSGKEGAGKDSPRATDENGAKTKPRGARNAGKSLSAAQRRNV